MTLQNKLTNKQMSAIGIKRTDNGSNGNLNEGDSSLKQSKNEKLKNSRQ